MACCIVAAVVVGLSARHGLSGPQAGIELGTRPTRVDDRAQPGPNGPSAAFTNFTRR